MDRPHFFHSYRTFLTGEELARARFPEDLEILVKRHAAYAFGDQAMQHARMERTSRAEPFPAGEVYTFEVCILSPDHLRELMEREYTRGVKASAVSIKPVTLGG